jgi:hypothetical protein
MLLPVIAGAYHWGPGQERLRDDRIEAAIEHAKLAALVARTTGALKGDAAAKSLWSDADAAYGEALDLVGDKHADVARALRLERDKAQMLCSKLPDARHDLEQLVDDLQADPNTDPALLNDARGSLANAQYYTTWLMRLEGAPREEWEPEIEASRQNYKLLAEQSEHSATPEATKKIAEDLEAAVRLERMNISELQGLPLPSQ